MEFGNWKASDIVSLRKYRKAMTYNPLPEVEAYWEALRGHRAMPLRSEIDPRGIERALDHTFLLERIAPGLARFRLAGKQLNELIGMEVRGMPITSCFAPDCRDQMRDALNMLFERPQIVKISLESKGGMGKPFLSGDMILMPLESDLGDVSRAIGCLQVHGKIGRAPRRFDLANIVYMNVGSQTKRQPAPKDVVQDEPLVGMAETAMKFEGKQNQKGGHLRLVHSDKRER